ncbi:TapY2 family type IVa secretion system protein [Colwellia psychrerythraea]|uniref:Lipoprotein n=1 Tax=Colwellia psychrerythraea TaxID=28229 RepID=A0A099KB39_COLPS|nr:TapY2 family type IVa secretion system protein [Colwellia psychrerythraea]KGJ87272.1 hypothetical protein ND2E_0679 [Colwellia psychrerythraea]
MNNLTKLISYMLLFSVFSVKAAIPDETVEKRATKMDETVDAKCHVALIDGSETILFYHVYSNKFPKLANEIVGKRVLTQKSNEKIKIYRVYECVLDNDDFTKANSKTLDMKIER